MRILDRIWNYFNTSATYIIGLWTWILVNVCMWAWTRMMMISMLLLAHYLNGMYNLSTKIFIKMVDFLTLFQWIKVHGVQFRRYRRHVYHWLKHSIVFCILQNSHEYRQDISDFVINICQFINFVIMIVLRCKR